MKNTLQALNNSSSAHTAVTAIGFWWIGLISAPGAGPTSQVNERGVVGTIAILAGTAVAAYFKRDLSGKKSI